MKLEFGLMPGGEVVRKSMIEMVHINGDTDPPTSVRFGITLLPDGKTWTAEGDMPLDQAATEFINYVVDEINERHPRSEPMDTDIVSRLRRAITTASNDDRSEPGTPERSRHAQRIHAMMDAVEVLQACQARDDMPG